mmetsp:Transcript_165056/g.317017  ORF Transcript_165056/g.317017 Transcript_165056/m.317017 type:complete len:464 (+) Transcript_165056:1-1392(+)
MGSSAHPANAQVYKPEEATMKLAKDLVAALFCVLLELLPPPASASFLRQRNINEAPPVDEVTVLKQEIKDLHKHEDSLKADKDALVATLQRFMAVNISSKSAKLEKKVADITDLKIAEEARFTHDRAVLESQVKKAEANSSSLREVMHDLQEQNLALQKELKRSWAEAANLTKQQKDAEADKEGLVTALQGMVRDNSKLKKELAKSKKMLDKSQIVLDKTEDELEKSQSTLKTAELRLQNLTRSSCAGANASAKDCGLHEISRKGVKKQVKKAKQHKKPVKKADDSVSARLARDPTAAMALTRDIDKYLDRVSRHNLVDQWVDPGAAAAESQFKEATPVPAAAKKDMGGRLTQYLGLPAQVVQQAAQEAASHTILESAVPAPRVGKARAKEVKQSTTATPAKVASATEARNASKNISASSPATASPETAEPASTKGTDDHSDGEDITKLLKQANAELDAAARA